MSLVLSAFFGLALATSASPIAPEMKAPAVVQSSLIAVARPLGFSGECLELHPKPKLTAQFEMLDKRYSDALANAEGVWPDVSRIDIEMSAMEAGSPFPSCRVAYVRTALKQAQQALNTHTRLLTQLKSKMDLRGAWLGPIQLCRDTVESTAFKTNELFNQPALSIKLASGHRAELSDVTGHAIGRPLAIRLDGSVIAKPVVNERIDAGEVEVSGPEHALLARLAERTLESC